MVGRAGNYDPRLLQRPIHPFGSGNHLLPHAYRPPMVLAPGGNTFAPPPYVLGHSHLPRPANMVNRPYHYARTERQNRQRHRKTDCVQKNGDRDVWWKPSFNEDPWRNLEDGRDMEKKSSKSNHKDAETKDHLEINSVSTPKSTNMFMLGAQDAGEIEIKGGHASGGFTDVHAEKPSVQNVSDTLKDPTALKKPKTNMYALLNSFSS